MSFKGLVFIRQWAKKYIYKARVLGEPQRSAPELAEASAKTQAWRRSSLKRLKRKSAPWRRASGS
ncbi:hypothetical protein MAXJ12_30072 [Mesorhizobium alhagi CCNWXJ12-2]|uniref:Uncharacterized protein n=1 Tax=Mesorhizobium alhagi CCNWXJ12-2 TaxID=1107882 RepID=H0I0M7_9HYPH|nr:hypothetical protein MAXJ12_30072 [Mesorhizobium alhagi CCNWXJ12-2]